MGIQGALTLVVGAAAVFVAYQAGVHQDRKRWYRERRAELYVDLLVEAYAEKQWCLLAINKRETVAQTGRLDADDEARYAQAEARLPPRLEPAERARLGARMAAYGSREVGALFSRIGPGVLWPTLGGRFALSSEVENAFDDVEAQIRKELGDATRLERAQQ